jgi:hypothetical protein
MAKMIHTACGGVMKNHQNGLKCSKCGYKLKHKEINTAYQSGKLDKQGLSSCWVLGMFLVFGGPVLHFEF